MKRTLNHGLSLKQGTGNGERGTGNGERGTGNGERGTGNGEWGTGESGNLNLIKSTKADFHSFVQ